MQRATLVKRRTTLEYVLCRYSSRGWKDTKAKGSLVEKHTKAPSRLITSRLQDPLLALPSARSMSESEEPTG